MLDVVRDTSNPAEVAVCEMFLWLYGVQISCFFPPVNRTESLGALNGGTGERFTVPPRSAY